MTQPLTPEETERLIRISAGSTYPNRIWEPSGRCGCGECRFFPSRTCPQKDSLDAITLWVSAPR